MASNVKTPGAKLSTNNYLVAVTIVSLLIVIVCGFAGKALAGKIVLDTKLILGKTKAKQDLDTKLKNIPVLIDNYDNLHDKQTLISDGLPTAPDFPEVITIMQNIASSSGV